MTYLSRDVCQHCPCFKECFSAYSNFMRCDEWVPNGAIWIEFELEEDEIEWKKMMEHVRVAVKKN